MKKYLPLVLIIIGVAMRFLPHLPNFSPVGAIALWSGISQSGKKTYLLPLAILFISDLFLGLHNLIPFVYGSFLLTTFIGRQLQRSRRYISISLGSLLAAISFFIITNFGVWLLTDMYPKNLDGLYLSYFFAIPFFRNSLLSDLFYTNLFFGIFYLLNRLPYVITRPSLVTQR